MTEILVNNAVTTIASAVNASVLLIPLASATAFPTSPAGTFRLAVDSEIMLCTGVTGSNAVIPVGGRGAEGTTAAAHGTGATIAAVWTAGGIAAYLAQIGVGANVYNIASPPFNADPNDIGPAVQAALLAVQANLAGGGAIYIPPRPDGTPWIWRSTVNVSFGIVGTGQFPPAVEIFGYGTVVQVIQTNPVTDFPLLNIIAQAQSLTVRDLIFIGSAVVNCVGLISLATGAPATATVRNITCYGIIADADAGVLDLKGYTSVAEDCRFYGSSNTRGLIAVSLCNTASINRCIFSGTGSFGGSGHSYANGYASSIYLTDVEYSGSITNCTADGAFSVASIWVHNLGIINRLSIRDNRLQTCSNFGTLPVIQIDGFACGDIDIENSVINNIGGHSGPDRAIMVNTAVTRLRLSRSTVQTDIVDPGIWPKFRLELQQNTGGPVEIEDVRNYKPFTSQSQAAGTTLLADFKLGAPTVLTERYDGVVTVHPVSLAPSHSWDAEMQVGSGTGFSGLNVGAKLLGTGGTFAAVTAGHQLVVRCSVYGTITIAFSGAEVGIAAFIAAMIAVSPTLQAANPINVSGQLQLTSAVSTGYNRSFGTVLASSSADVLTSLGLTARNFETLPRLTALADNCGNGGTATNNLTGTCAYQELDTDFLICPSLQFTATTDNLVSGTFATIPQPFTIMLIAKHMSAVQSYLMDGLTADTAGVRFNAAQTQLQLNFGAGYTSIAATTPTPSIYIIEVNGAATKVWVNSDSTSTTVAASPGTNSLTGVTLGNTGGGGATAAVKIASACIVPGQLPKTQRQQAVAYYSRRYGIPLV